MYNVSTKRNRFGGAPLSPDLNPVSLETDRAVIGL